MRLFLRSGIRALPTIATAIVALATLTTARAQDIDDPEEDAPVAQNMVMNELHESNFDLWVFGNGRNNGSPRDRLDSLLTLSLDEVERACKLTEAQKKKLLLAGHGDLKHFLDRVAEARDVFNQLRRDQTRINEIFQMTQPLAASIRSGLFGDDSFFAKTLRTTLDPTQAEGYRELLREKNRYRYTARVNLAVATLDGAVGFTAEQRRKLVELTLRETTPGQKPAGQHENQVVLLKMSRIPEDRLRPIVDEARYRLLRQQLQNAKNMEAFLRNQGYLDEPEPGPAKQKAEIHTH